MRTYGMIDREPWCIDDSEFYELENRQQEMEFLLRYAILAPSGHNTQPWSFAIVPEGIEAFADSSRRLPEVDPDNRELLMSIGAAIMNLRVAAAHFGFDSSVLYPGSPSETSGVALVSLTETCAPDASLGRLFPAIMHRRTNRQRFNGEPIESDAVSALCDVADEYPAFVHFLRPGDKRRIAELVAQGDRLQRESRAIRKELASWMRWSRTRHDRSLIDTAPLLVIITADDDPPSLVEAGQVLERLLLTATRVGLQYSFMNQPVQVATLRSVLAPIVPSPYPPQLLLRFGYAPPVEHAMPRRDVTEVLR